MCFNCPTTRCRRQSARQGRRRITWSRRKPETPGQLSVALTRQTCEHHRKDCGSVTLAWASVHECPPEPAALGKCGSTLPLGQAAVPTSSARPRETSSAHTYSNPFRPHVSTGSLGPAFAK